MEKHLSYIFKILFSLAILYFIFLQVNFREVFSHIKNANFAYLFLAFLSACLSTVVSSKKWQILMKSAQLKMRFKDSIYFNFLSLFYSSFLPGGMLTGETIKCYKVSKGQYGKNKIIMSVAFDRLITFACYIFMGTFFYCWFIILRLKIIKSF